MVHHPLTDKGIAPVQEGLGRGPEVPPRRLARLTSARAPPARSALDDRPRAGRAGFARPCGRTGIAGRASPPTSPPPAGWTPLPPETAHPRRRRSPSSGSRPRNVAPPRLRAAARRVHAHRLRGDPAAPVQPGTDPGASRTALLSVRRPGRDPGDHELALLLGADAYPSGRRRHDRVLRAADRGRARVAAPGSTWCGWLWPRPGSTLLAGGRLVADDAVGIVAVFGAGSCWALYIVIGRRMSPVLARRSRSDTVAMVVAAAS